MAIANEFCTVLKSKKLRLNDVTTHEYEQAHQKANSRRWEGTGVWLQRCVEFQEWLRDGSSGLWINGFGMTL